MANPLILISEAKAASDVPGLLARVREGVDFVIENGGLPLVVMQTQDAPRRTLEECMALVRQAATRTESSERDDSTPESR